MKKVTALIAVAISLAVLPVPAPAEPPPHAKAHGWRKKNDPNYVGYTGKRWEKDYGVVDGRCNTQAVGAVVGGVIGGAVGSRVGERENRPVAILVGTAIGAVIGAKIGQEIDNADRACMGHALELAGTRKRVEWRNDATGVAYRLTPVRDFKEGRAACREFVTELVRGGKRDRITDVACRRGAGDWVLKG